MSTQDLYTLVLKYFIALSVLCFPTLFVIPAPFGRFALSTPSIFRVDGIRAWIVMEIVSPITFVSTFLSHADPAWDTRTLLASVFVVHYLNRALVSPLRTPARSKSHILVTLLGAVFNLANGFLQGHFLATSPLPVHRPVAALVAGLAVWALGFAGNVYHDEILLDLRRGAPKPPAATSGAPNPPAAATDSKATSASASATTSPASWARSTETASSSSSSQAQQPRYVIPYGGLYRWISYPNYFCECVEFAGFAWAAAAPPPLSFPCAWRACVTSSATLWWSSVGQTTLLGSILEAWESWTPTVPAPWAFVIAEVCVLLPRAVVGHRWYKRRFGDEYPKERWAIIPGLI